MKQKLIDQLLHKAGARFGAEGIDYSDFTSSKFVELIVKECAALVKGQPHVDKMMDCNSVIKQHFGVEE